MLGLDACAKELVACVQPIALSLADVRCSAQVTDVDALCLLDGSSAVSTSSRHRFKRSWLMSKLIAFFLNLFLALLVTA
jgi:hypothetical protein